METIMLLLWGFVAIGILSLFYLGHQLKRNEEVYRIRMKWIEEGDKRWDKYSYGFMYDPSKHNLYGLRWPKESDYP